MKSIDLHVHSNRSDGTLSPSAVVDLALSKGLAAIALTDHDTTDGLDEALEAAEAARANGADFEVVRGIEFSTEYEGKDIHIVGLDIDHKGEAFSKYLKDFQDARDNRNRKMCEKLREHGVDITYENLCAEFPGSVLTRAHYAKYMLKCGAIKSIPEAFERYIGDNAPCFLPREAVTPESAVSLILESGGIPILAHPVLYHMSDERLEKLIVTLKEVGLVGIEAHYSTYTPADERQIRSLADKYGLRISGGSDFHGETKAGLDMGTGYGSLFVPYEVLENLRAE